MKSKKESEIINEIRLNKYIASCGICSRRKADELITNGLVKVNGKVIKELGYKVVPMDNVSVNNKKIRAENKVYLVLNKPKDTVTTTKDPQNRKTVLQCINLNSDLRIFPVGRLDRNTTGVLLLTNDGDFSYSLTHPSKNVIKTYLVHLDKSISATDLEKLISGVLIDHEKHFFDSIDILEGSSFKKIVVHLHSGKYHIVKKMFETINYKVVHLDRIVFAGITKSGLKRGEWRYLSLKEINNLFTSKI
ncbi:MAG: rRNA pseudouridine synthase [Bacteroidetes bacterium]|nr:rRNA pseudouridine synthase [Bacteroidota bacterium]